MIVAQEKRKSNIVEYILYMWQVEDIIRALDFNLDKINDVLVANYNVDEPTKKSIADWYKNLVIMMQKEQLKQTGHLQFIKNVTDDLNRFHLTLLQEQTNPEYNRQYAEIKNDIQLVRNKSVKNHHDIEVALNTLYLILMLKMKKQDITEATQQVVWKFGNFMGQLSSLYKAYENGDIEINF